MSKHTPGPWTFEVLIGPDSRGMGYIIGGDGREVSHHGVSERWLGENLANARLIAAAPDMLEALVEVRSSLTELGVDGWSDASHLMNVVGAAIDKAEGRS